MKILFSTKIRFDGIKTLFPFVLLFVCFSTYCFKFIILDRIPVNRYEKGWKFSARHYANKLLEYSSDRWICPVEFAIR